MSIFGKSLQERIALDQANLKERADRQFNPEKFVADSQGVKSNKSGFDPAAALRNAAAPLAAGLPGGFTVAPAMMLGSKLYDAATNQDATGEETITEPEGESTLLDFPQQPDFTAQNIQMGEQALSRLAQERQSILDAPVPTGMGKQRRQLDRDALELIDQQEANLQRDQMARMAEMDRSDARIQQYEQRMTQINQEHQERMLELQREEEVADFVASHPNAREGDLLVAYEKLRDPNTPDEERARLSAALERSKEVNPYRMLQTPGGMLAAVASIIVGGLNRDKDPSAMLNKALQNDLALQQQRQKQRREKVERLAKKKGNLKEVQAYLVQQEQMEMDIFQRRTALAMEKLGMMAKGDEGRAALEASRLGLREQIQQRKAAAAARANRVRQQRELALNEAQMKAIQGALEAEKQKVKDRVELGGLFIEPKAGKEPTTEDRKRIQEGVIEYGQSINELKEIEEALADWENGISFSDRRRRVLNSLITKANLQEGKRLFGVMSEADMKQLEKIALSNVGMKGTNFATGKVKDLKAMLSKTKRAGINNLKPIVQASGYEIIDPIEIGSDGFAQTANLGE